jgi:uncharacterized protein YbaP (TraB family)
MPRRALVAIAALLGGAVFSPLARAETSVWKVTRDGSTLYLGGTFHILRPRDFPLPPEYDAAYAASSRLCFETNVERMLSDELLRVVETQGMYTDGRSLEKILSPKVWRAVQEYGDQSGVAPERFVRVKPWLLIILMAGIEMEKLGITKDGVDLFYYRLAKKAKKPVGELETFEDHIAFLTRLGEGRENEMIAQTLEDMDEIPQHLRELIAAWRTGDLPAIDQLTLDDMRTKYPAIYQDLIVSRNTAWLPRIEKLLATPETEFVLAGVAHMAGPDGLIAQLRAKGCTVEQVNTPQPARKTR